MNRRFLLGNTKYFRDPSFLPRWYGANTLLIRSWNALTVNSSSTQFFTGAVGSIDRIPGTQYTSTGFTDSVWKTVASVSGGSGLISDIVGPQNAGGGAAADCEFRFTVDDVLYPTILVDLTSTNQRAWLGWGLPLNAYHAASQYIFQHDGIYTLSGYAAQVNAAASYLLMGPQDPRIPGLVMFSRNLLVEMRTVGNSSSGAAGDYAAVVMRRLS